MLYPLATLAATALLIAGVVNSVEITNPGELISQLLTGATKETDSKDDLPLAGRQNLDAALAARRRRPQPLSPRDEYEQQDQWTADDSAKAPRVVYKSRPPVYQPQSQPNTEYEVELQPNEQLESDNAYVAEKPVPVYKAPPKQTVASKPTPYDPTPYADTLYCLDCQDKCNLQLAPQCPTGRGWYKHADSCYYFEPSIQLAWREARGFCAGLTDETGTQRGHLVIINDARENEYLRSLHHYLQKGGFPTMFWTDLATTSVSLNASADPLVANAVNGTAGNSSSSTTPIPVEWFTYQADGFVSHFRSMFNNFAAATGSCGTLQYYNDDAIEVSMRQSELYWGLDDCASQRPPLCEIDLDGNPFN